MASCRLLHFVGRLRRVDHLDEHDASTVTVALSLVITSWRGTSSTCLHHESLRPTRSTNGIRN